ncbi:MAG: tetratricopeptide repeat protein [Verrucomicrobiota bacterium]
MAQIIKFPVQASKCGYKRVKNRVKTLEQPGQLYLRLDSSAEILRFSPEQSCFEHALLLDERGDARAADLYREAIQTGDCAADAYCNLGIIESQKGDTTTAFNCFTTCLQHDPRHAEAHYNLANLYFELNDLRLAQVHYELAGEIAPAFANVHFNLALVHALNADFLAAAQALTRYQQLVPANEARIADELLENLRRSLAITPPPNHAKGSKK